MIKMKETVCIGHEAVIVIEISSSTSFSKLDFCARMLGSGHKSRNIGSEERFLNLVTRCPLESNLVVGSSGRTAKTDMGLSAPRPSPPTP